MCKDLHRAPPRAYPMANPPYPSFCAHGRTAPRPFDPTPFTPFNTPCVFPLITHAANKQTSQANARARH